MKKTSVFLLALLFLCSVSSAQSDSTLATSGFLSLHVKSLEAKVVDKSVQLTWTVPTNEDAKNFEIERADDGVNFRKIGGRLAVSQRGEIAYDFVDALPRKYTLFSYRVRINGKDGSASLSDVQGIKVGDESLQCRLKQNPVRHTLELEITTPAPVQLLATIFTGYGQKQTTESTKLSVGTTTVFLSSEKLQAGLHRLVLEAGNERKVISFVKE